MNNKTGLHLSRALALAVALSLSAQAPIVQAEIVDTDALATPSQVELDRAKVQAFMDRATARERLEAMGISGLVAKDRVASLNEAEVHALAQRIDTMPAGGNLSNSDLVIILLVLVLTGRL